MAAERPFSPVDGIYLKDDFMWNGAAVTTGNIGELGWNFTTIGNASTFLPVASPWGTLRMTTGSTADGDGSVLHLDADQVLVEKGGVKPGGFAFRVMYDTELASSNFRIGLSSSVTATAPTDSILVESDAGVITLRVDSADHGDVSQAAAGVSTLTSGTTCVVGTWHDFLVTWSGENGQGGPRNVELWIDDEPAASVIAVLDNDETMECSIAHWQDSGGADAVALTIDYYEYWQYRP